MLILFKLFLEFFKIGMFAIGGGLSTLPFFYELAEKYPFWLKKNFLVDMIAIAESTPGPIGINISTFVGFNFGKNIFSNNIFLSILTAIITTIFLVFPSVIIILIIAKYFHKFKENKFVKSAFYGIRPAVVALIFLVIFEIFKISIFKVDENLKISFYNFINCIDLKSLFLFILIFLMIFVFKIKKHPIFYIILAGVIGIFFKL